jgi:hypothetical protein
MDCDDIGLGDSNIFYFFNRSPACRPAGTNRWMVWPRVASTQWRRTIDVSGHWSEFVKDHTLSTCYSFSVCYYKSDDDYFPLQENRTWCLLWCLWVLMIFLSLTSHNCHGQESRKDSKSILNFIPSGIFSKQIERSYSISKRF